MQPMGACCGRAGQAPFRLQELEGKTSTGESCRDMVPFEQLGLEASASCSSRCLAMRRLGSVMKRVLRQRRLVVQQWTWMMAGPSSARGLANFEGTCPVEARSPMARAQPGVLDALADPCSG